MSHRERWTVYPLLFLSLGLGLRDKIAPTFEAEQIQCRALALTDATGEEVLTMQGGSQGGRLAVLDSDGREVTILGGGAVVCRDLAIVDSRGATALQIGDTPDGARIDIVNAQGRPLVSLGGVHGAAGFVEAFDVRNRRSLVRLGPGSHGVLVQFSDVGFPILLPAAGLEEDADARNDEQPENERRASEEPEADDPPASNEGQDRAE